MQGPLTGSLRQIFKNVDLCFIFHSIYLFYRAFLSVTAEEPWSRVLCVCLITTNSVAIMT